ncbi:MAG: VOC family protein [Planctomycetaceae bacterium]|nr:MAG: VOC family protein [Planctomycetaceae bacterium]
MKIEPYLFFDGHAEEAIAFYEKALGAKREMMMRFSESPEPTPEGRMPVGFENKIMHASFLIGDARVMVSDGGAMTGKKFGGFALSLPFPDEAKARLAFEALAEGGQIDMPLGETFWSPCFGMITDRFGVQWMITI